MANGIAINQIDNEVIISELAEIFREVFEDEEIVVNNNTTSEDIGSWDSLSHMLMIDEVEKRFSIKFKLSEIVKLKNVGGLAQLIESKLHSQII